MYCDKANVNILTALLVAYGIRHAVCCPGSRNAPIVHNLNECPDIQCWPVTDERSAGFYALGMALYTGDPVAVCITSGTALLNLAPAVAEAYYQHVPLVVISADRPQKWIDQLDGQTLPQPDALGRFVRKAVNLPEIEDDVEEQHWYCNRLVCEALMEATNRGGGPVHINVPISEPLFQFNVEELPRECCIGHYGGVIDSYDIEASGLLADFWNARRPMIVIGQNRETLLGDHELEQLRKHAVVLYEPLGSDLGTTLFDEVLRNQTDDDDLLPDFVLYGGMMVSKRLKQFLRKATNADFWEISPDGQLHDTYKRTKGVIEGRFAPVLLWLEEFLADTATVEEQLEKSFGELTDTSDFVTRWKQELNHAAAVVEATEPPYSPKAVVKHFEQQLTASDIVSWLHYANSTAVRLACLYSTSYVYCNRGVNGIEGSLSTAAGFSLVAANDDADSAQRTGGTDSSSRLVFCVIGDLSFFYDQNALWNQQLSGNFRILLLNNGGGGIFAQLPGLEQSPARDKFVAAQHHTSAEGICQQNAVGYRKAENMAEMQEGVRWLINSPSERPLLLEVTNFT